MPLTQPLRIQELSPEELAVYRTLDPERIPEHVAIIMDGNGRWAGNRTMKRFQGHQQGAEAVLSVVEAASRINVPYLTLYAFSLENNLRRPQAEVGFLMKLVKVYLAGNIKRMQDNNVRMNYIGRLTELPEELQDTMRQAKAETANNTGTMVTLALNYGSRAEIVDATRSLVRNLMTEARRRGCSLEDLISVNGGVESIDENAISQGLYTHDMPDPDLLIRTSGEMRLSNYMLWQLAYAELFVTERLWPDFLGVHLLEAIATYQQRSRRFGGLDTEFSDEALPEPTAPLPRP
ncbi:undecaprenyl diphosphate synthase [Terriglobus roseus DSM 18391]|uniref:Isoprenyl transferase n=1 Tax=Terriglobus roseus (strain DSM 18391 / NRRL B-41598 / KBS 63) TaxID=926566 RepID=I3ZDD4_TERRK|nr:polyprenyl diphosphate synthase [Terriglobus roseus]AFL87252.1 undecaprenyl diphosphate synthase [Terriglobus roseus DSM 18391]